MIYIYILYIPILSFNHYSINLISSYRVLTGGYVYVGEKDGELRISKEGIPPDRGAWVLVKKNQEQDEQEDNDGKLADDLNSSTGNSASSNSKKRGGIGSSKGDGTDYYSTNTSSSSSSSSSSAKPSKKDLKKKKKEKWVAFRSVEGYYLAYDTRTRTCVSRNFLFIYLFI